MKGRLFRTEKDGWVITAAPNVAGMGMLLVHEDNVRELSLLPFDGKFYTEGKDVEFEVVPVCSNCGQDECNNLQCRGHKDDKYARILEPVETWEDIRKRYSEYEKEQLAKPQGASDLKIFSYWLELNYKAPVKL